MNSHLARVTAFADASALADASAFAFAYVPANASVNKKGLV